ncbi:LuxR C-terminal-related transcriptional regulator [Eubacterium barkeri]|uniref:ATP-, maltotriose-and DNA-dependent transcriptional regulator MalT n=1 Tax=Eubacterium barkeri TaxID=1528 RepID=A0A1H3GVC3_EUBBA|nr:LuxR C-terminal-related transcriptional regulator [Eubacterium barkeri]SDY07256.1 ATP-, maltotriose-and DNA-dependent transcriptional regulator MalT [Eubacterium barkeri]
MADQMENIYWKQPLHILSESTQKVVYLFAKMGWGKTEIVKQWLEEEKHPHHWIDCTQRTTWGKLKEWLSLEPSDNCHFIILDSFQNIRNTERLTELMADIKASPKAYRFIIMSRTMVPSVLRPMMIRRELKVMGESELSMDKAAVKTYLAQDNIQATDEEAAEIRAISGGWPMALNAIILEIKENGGTPIRGCRYVQSRRYLYDLIAEEIYLPLGGDLRRNLMLLGMYETFDEEMAAVLMDVDNPRPILQDILQIGSFLTEFEPGKYHFTPFMYYFFMDRRERCDQQQIYIEANRRLGHYFEAKAEYVSALEAFYTYGLYEEGIRVLKTVLSRPPDSDVYYEMEPFLEKTPALCVERDPLLCYSMAMIHSLNYRVAECKDWYDRLLALEAEGGWSAEELKVIRIAVIHGKIAIPCVLGDRKVIRPLLEGAALIRSGVNLFNGFTVTGNQPRIMAGSRDFCNWCHHARLLEKFLKRPLQQLLGKKAVGIVDIGFGEKSYQEDDLDTCLIHAAKALADCEGGGTLDTLFVAKALLAQGLVARGKLGEAKSTMLGFRDRLVEEGGEALLRNVMAFRIGQSLLEGPNPGAIEWLEDEGIDESIAFHTTDRYGYLIKIRALLCSGGVERALPLIELIHAYALDYQRTYNVMETLVLKAICLHKMGRMTNALAALEKALAMARNYHFIRVFADEGGGILPVLEALPKTSREEDFVKKVTEATRAFQEQYPKYYGVQGKLDKGLLTNAEQVVLSQIATGRSNVEIAEFLSVSLATVKTHINRIYHKLGVKNRTQALLKAERLGIIENG